MARELKIGIAVIGVLLAVFCGLLAKRLTSPSKLPLNSVSSKSSAKTEAAAPKTTPPAHKATLITPQAEPNPLRDVYASDSTKAQTGLQTPRDDASIKTAQSNLLTTQTPIRDLETRPQPGTTGSLPHHTGYAGAGDAAEVKTDSTAATTAQHADPFLSRPSARKSPVAAAEPKQTGRYPDYETPSTATSAAQHNRYPYDRSYATPPAYPTDYNQISNQSPNQTPRQMANSDPRYSPQQSNPAAAQQTTPPPPSYSQQIYGNDYFSGPRQAESYSQPPTPAASNTISVSQTAARVERDGENYTVQPNDTFWTICEKVYGTGAFFKALYEYNRKKHKQADALVVGQELLVPDENVLRRHYPDLCPRQRKDVASTEQRLISASTRLRGGGRVYKVVEGDTLYDVAKYELGKASRWAEIYDLNRDLLGDDFDYLRPGTELILPSDAPRTDNITQQPGHTVPGAPVRF